MSSDPSFLDGAARVPASRPGVVVIGRNEGERLRLCLQSLLAQSVGEVVYVDSGSSDGSVALATALGVEVVSLDMSQPFTAARARNAGARRLLERSPDVALIQFVDGDCEVAAGWMAAASAFLADHDEVAAVCGRRRERFPERSIYNLLCDIEWSTPIGLAKACGGDMLVRASAFAAVEGFRSDLIAGEEPELCIRLRRDGWLIWRLDAEMTLHDAAMLRIGQWWKRAMRAGFAYAEGAALHGAPPERHWVRESRSAWAWGLALPLVILAGAVLVSPVVWLALLLYPLQVLRLFLRERGSLRLRWARASFLVLGKFAEAAGQLRFFAQRLTGSRGRLIEYK